MSNSQLCFLIGNLWLMVPILTTETGVVIVYLIIGSIFLVISLATRKGGGEAQLPDGETNEPK